MQWSDKLPLFRKLAGAGEDIPALSFKPNLNVYQQSLYDAFIICNGSRQYTMSGAVSIPISEILAFLNMYNIDDLEEREEYLTLIQAADNAYLEHIRSKADQPST